MIQLFKLNGSIKKAIHEYIHTHLDDVNPYNCEQVYAESLSQYIFEQLETADGSEENKLYELVKKVQNSSFPAIPPIHIKNIAGEPAGSLLPPRENRGFDYSDNPYDRMKTHFYTEWTSWAVALLFRHTNLIHPSEHGGKNRFHMVSPISGVGSDSLSASTGGGEFVQHSDATVFTTINTPSELRNHLKSLSTSSSIASSVLRVSEETFESQVLCGKYSRVDATMLTGIVNENTKTLITTPEMLQTYLTQQKFGKVDFQTLSKMPIAHIAGPADGEISGYIGNITSPIQLNDTGDIVGTCINLAPGRMKYVGEKKKDKMLFDDFCRHAIDCPNIEVLVEASDILLFPNLASAEQPNVTHGREKISHESYRVEVNGTLLRRNLCRQYLVHCDSILKEELNHGVS